MAATSPARTPRAVLRDMTRADICNVEPLASDDFEALGFEDGCVDEFEALGFEDGCVDEFEGVWTLTEGGALCG